MLGFKNKFSPFIENQASVNKVSVIRLGLKLIYFGLEIVYRNILFEHYKLAEFSEFVY